MHVLTTTPDSLRPLLIEQQVAQTLNISRETLRKWRQHGAGPQFLKLGRSVRYRPEVLQAFLASSIKEVRHA
jgi:predicted DNA-binding transcriptional regulator AlpA